jgi:hypothetical protein
VGRGRDGPCGPPPAQIRTCGLRSIRLLAWVIATPLGAVCRASSLHSSIRPCGKANGRFERHCPCAAAFPPFPPPRPAPVCSGTSTVLRNGPTAWARSSSAYGHALSDAIGAGLLHQCGLLHGRCTQALPIPAHNASVRAQVSDPAECFHPLPKRDSCCCLPCALTTSALESCTLISGLNTGPTHPLSTLRERHYCRSRMTWGQGGWLGLPCWGLAPLPLCRF